MIPIVIKDFEWSQNDDFIFILLEIKGVRTASTDIISSPTYLKVHYSPFIFEIFLNHEVEDEQSECTIDENSGKVSFKLKKVTSGVLWEQVENKGLTKEEKSLKRAEAVEITQERHKKELAEKDKRRFDRKQATVHEQMRIDGEVRERIEKIKNLEGEKALTEFNKWAESADDSTSTTRAIEMTRASGDWNREEKQTKATPIPKGNNDPHRETEKELCERKKTTTTPPEKIECSGRRTKVSNQIFDDPALAQAHPVGIRPTVRISVNFTPRIFPTPSRESTHVEEQEWLKKQAEARRLSGFVDEDLRPEERNPQWLLDKGLSLMRTESYLGAISAFSLGIRLAPKMPELFVERAGAHLAVKNYHRTVADCTQALELLTPKVPANLEDRLKCHVRRGSAFRELEMWEEALTDYKEAILLKPENDEELTLARDEIEKALEKARKEKQEWEHKERAKVQGRATTTPHSTTTLPNTSEDGASSEED